MKKQKDFCDMANDEKRKFLSMDMTERMIRIEQTVASHFGDKIEYKDTNYFKSLPSEKKKEFAVYLKKKNGRNKILKLSAIVIPLISLAFVKFGVTGNAIKESIGEIGANLSGYCLICLFLAVLVTSLVLTIFKKNKDQEFNEKTKVLYGLYQKSK